MNKTWNVSEWANKNSITLYCNLYASWGPFVASPWPSQHLYLGVWKHISQRRRLSGDHSDSSEMEPAVRSRPLGFTGPFNSLPLFHPRSDPKGPQSVFSFFLPPPPSPPFSLIKNTLNRDSRCGVQLRDLLWLLLDSFRSTFFSKDLGNLFESTCMYSSQLWHALAKSKVGPFVPELYVSSLHL